MRYEEVKCVEYDGDLWAVPEQAPHPALTDLLVATDHLVTLRCGEPPFRVVLGVPHHVAAGEEWICERRLDAGGAPVPRAGDEAAALYALVAFSLLRDHGVPCKLVVMAHATTHDPNKHLEAPYIRELFADATGLLFECHGAAPSRPLDLELSAGCNHLADTMAFGRALASALGHAYVLGVQKQAGKRRAWILRDGAEEEGVLELSALETHSLIEAGRRGVPALHLEAKPTFRRPDDVANIVTPEGRALGRAIAHVIMRSGGGHRVRDPSLMLRTGARRD